MSLTERERAVLKDVVELHEAHGSVVMHGRMNELDRQAVDSLAVGGLVEVRPTRKDQPRDERLVVPTTKGHRHYVGV